MSNPNGTAIHQSQLDELLSKLGLVVVADGKPKAKASKKASKTVTCGAPTIAGHPCKNSPNQGGRCTKHVGSTLEELEVKAELGRIRQAAFLSARKEYLEGLQEAPKAKKASKKAKKAKKAKAAKAAKGARVDNRALAAYLREQGIYDQARWSELKAEYGHLFAS